VTLGATLRGCTHIRISAPPWRHATALALFVLLLLPVNYRAGAAYPHNHALVQLIFETRSGIPIHSHGVDRPHDNHGAGVATSQSGAPSIQIFANAGLLPLVLIALALLTIRISIRRESEPKRTGCSCAPGHPPPQQGPALITSP
jgi:hypothetical protein